MSATSTASLVALVESGPRVAFTGRTETTREVPYLAALAAVGKVAEFLDAHRVWLLPEIDPS